MLKYAGKRLLQVIPTILGLSILVFVIMHVIPGDPARIMLGHAATEQQIQALREELGLTKPIATQYIIFLENALHGDLGRSISEKGPVVQAVVDRFPATVELAVAAIIFASVIGVVAGVMAAVKHGTFWDGATMTGAVAGVSMPVFWLGLMLMFVFTVKFHVLPPSGRITAGSSLATPTGLFVVDSIISGNWAALGDVLRHLILPTVALGAVSTGLIARMTRSAMLEVTRSDYIRTARAKGLAERTVIYKHALKNASIPVVTIIGLSVGSLLGGAVLTETIFSWPGVGRLMLDSISKRDFPLVQGCVILLALVVISVNLVVDLFYAYIDPRIRYE